MFGQAMVQGACCSTQPRVAPAQKIPWLLRCATCCQCFSVPSPLPTHTARTHTYAHYPLLPRPLPWLKPHPLPLRNAPSAGSITTTYPISSSASSSATGAGRSPARTRRWVGGQGERFLPINMRQPSSPLAHQGQDESARKGGGGGSGKRGGSITCEATTHLQLADQYLRGCVQASTVTPTALASRLSTSCRESGSVGLCGW